MERHEDSNIQDTEMHIEYPGGATLDIVLNNDGDIDVVANGMDIYVRPFSSNAFTIIAVKGD